MNICNSCAMPMKDEKEFATEKDGSKNKDYCIYCYKEGNFTYPNLTLDQMLSHLDEVMTEHNMPEEMKNEIKSILPKLKRWKKAAPKRGCCCKH